MACELLSGRTLTIRDKSFSPPYFLAPMAGLTHSALRRLVADFGGYGALFTEMLSGTALLSEKCGLTPFTRRRENEGNVIYQLLLTGAEDCESIIDRIARLNPTAIDLNLACPAPGIRKIKAGAMLFADMSRLRAVVRRVRKKWPGLLTAKCRLGSDPEKWKESFVDRIHLLEDEGIEGLIVHPRFFNEKFKRVARWKYLPWIAEQTNLPVIASGDICTPEVVKANADCFRGVKGIMIGRMAVVKPWIFREFNSSAFSIDYLEVWERFCSYVLEDFPESKALARIKQFASYYARNFFFGHQFFAGIQNAPNVSDIRRHADSFLRQSPQTVAQPSVVGI